MMDNFYGAPCISLSYRTHFFFELDIFQTTFEGNIKTHILYYVHFFRKSCLYEITLKNIVKSVNPRMTKWRIRISHLAPGSTYAHSEYETIIAILL
jgi:hypothetical protein